MARRSSLSHVAAGVLLVRATTDPGDLTPPGNLDLFGDAAAEGGSAWLAKAWQRQDVRDAVDLASPALALQVSRALAERPDVRVVRRLVISVASYLSRWQGRATPFGLFAGVAAAQVGAVPVARWGEQHRVTARPGAAWLHDLAGRLERHAGLLEHLPVVVNNSAFVRGDRLVIPGQPPDDHPGQPAPLEVSIRRTRPVQAALEAARQPCPFGHLVRQLSAGYPAVTTGRIRALLAELVAQRVLLSAVRPPMTEQDPLAYVIAQLTAAGTDALDSLGDLPARLAEIHDELARLNRTACGGAGSMPGLALAARRMKAVCSVAEHPLIVDVGLDCDITVPELVIREAESAASALLRLTAYPFGYPRWKDYHIRFKNRYGSGAVVPVRELVLADSGLGLPDGYLGSPAPAPGRLHTTRDDTILALVQRALIEQREEIALTEPDIESLTVGELSERLLPPRVELAFRIQAAAADAVACGNFRLILTGAPRPASSMAGRFADLLPDASRAALSGSFQTREADQAQMVAAQLSFPARCRHSENVVRTPQLLPLVISLSEHRSASPGIIGLDDLAVSADARELFLVQLPTGRRVEPQVLHALEASVLTPPLARFLAEIAIARCAVYAPFDWGSAARLPYLPRLRYGRTVLAPARWLLAASDLPGLRAAMSCWEDALDAWRQRHGVPARVVLCESELRLPLNLDDRLHRAVLRARLSQDRQVEVREDPGLPDQGWPGRAHEFLLPMRLTHPRKASPPMSSNRVVRSASRSAGQLPGISAVLYAQVPGHPDRQDEILTNLPRLLKLWEVQPMWWYSRHRELSRPDTSQYLELYLRLHDPEDYGLAAARTGRWAAGLRDAGLVPHLRLATYHPETGRYGDGTAMAAAERVFAADSAAALAQIAAARSGAAAQALAAASLVDLACSFATNISEGMRWLMCTLPKDRGGHARSLRETALELAGPLTRDQAVRALPGGDDVAAAWEQRRQVLVTYRQRLAEQRDPRSALRSLLHMHHVRSLGVDPERERVSNRLARAAALRHLARNSEQAR